MPGIVMKAKVIVKIGGATYYEWFIVENPLIARHEVTKKEAMDYIEENGLVEVQKNEHGIIWDTPNREFKRRYRNIFARKSNESLFDEIWK